MQQLRAQPLPADQAAALVLETLSTLTRDLHPGDRRRRLHLDSSLERDAGLDSVARMELLGRLERSFGTRLPEEAVIGADSCRDLCSMLAANGAAQPPTNLRIVERPESHPSAEPEPAVTLVQLLERQAESRPDWTCIHLYDANDRGRALHPAELLADARRIAAALQRHGLTPGRPVATTLPTGREFIVCFFGILLAGGVPLPLSPALRPSQVEELLRRQAAILRSAGAELLIATPQTRSLSRLLDTSIESLRAVVTADELLAEPGEPSRVPLAGHDAALLQYTSGSTGRPKGVVLTHDNLLANLRAIGAGVAMTPQDTWVSWLPLYHDMGLIGGLLNALHHSIPLVLLPPLSFLARPERWLWAIHRHRATLTVAPNFGYELCVRRPADDVLRGLDLTSLRLALNGAEPVGPGTIERFTRRFAAYGFHPEAMLPVYGLAENSLAVAFSSIGRPPVIDAIDREPFLHSGDAVPTRSTEDVLRHVSCGLPLLGNEVRIVDEQSHELGDRCEGRLQFRGLSATGGYLHDAEATEQLFDGTWLESGDLAYTVNGEVFVTGRSKDVIIRAGRNIQPHALEDAVGDLDGVRKGCVVAFGSSDAELGTEKLVVAVETRDAAGHGGGTVRQRVEDLSLDLLGLVPDDVVFVAPRTLPKTSSGKIRRFACRDMYEADRLAGGAGRPAWLQLARLAASAIAERSRRLRRTLPDTLFTIRGWCVLGPVLAGAWFGVLLIPGLSWRRRWARVCSRLFFTALAPPLRIEGLDRLPADGPFVLVANHASYLDSMIVLAAVQRPLTFVAKRELNESFFAGLLLRRLGTIYVERLENGGRADDLRRMTEAAASGEPLAIFVEGTFDRRPGLKAFRLGAFAAAAKAGAVVVPMAIRGNRELLRDEQWWFRRRAVEVKMGAPITPQGTDFHQIVELRDRARRCVLEWIDEPDLLGDERARP